MKLKQIALAVAAVACANSAFAILPGQEGNSNPRMDIWMSGATALDKQLQNYYSSLCDTSAGTVHRFSDSASKPQGDAYSATYCVVTAASSGIAGFPTTNVMLHKRSKGGSAWGVGPVAGASAIEQMVITVDGAQDVDGDGVNEPSNCTNTGNTITTGSGSTTVSAALYTCNKNVTRLHVSDAGISDVEPKLFNETANLIQPADDGTIVLGDPGTVAIDQAMLDNMDVQAMNGTTFGIAVTKSLYRALQAAQGKNTASDEVSEMPSLSRDQIAALLSGNLNSWESFKVNNGGTIQGLRTFALAQGLLSDRDNINICRRTEGSGTQAQANAIFLGVGCDAGALAPAVDNSTSSALAGGTGVGTDNKGTGPAAARKPTVHENLGSGDVDKCMEALENYAAGPIWGIGIQSLEKASTTDKYRFVAINRVAPTLENVVSNEYIDWVTTSIQWRNGPVGGIAAPSGDKLKMLQALRTGAASPTEIASLNASLRDGATDLVLYEDGTTTRANIGAVALFYKGYTPSLPFSAANPVSTASREGASGSGKPDSCKTPIVYRDSMVIGNGIN